VQGRHDERRAAHVADWAARRDAAGMRHNLLQTDSRLTRLTATTCGAARDAMDGTGWHPGFLLGAMTIALPVAAFN